MSAELTKTEPKRLQGLRPGVKKALARVKQLDDYMEQRAAANLPPTVESLALYLGVCVQSLINWSNGGDERYAPLVEAYKRVKLTSQADLVDKLYQSKSNPNAMFLLKCRHGWIEEEKRQDKEQKAVEVNIHLSGDTSSRLMGKVGKSQEVEIQVDNEASQPDSSSQVHGNMFS